MVLVRPSPIKRVYVGATAKKMGKKGESECRDFRFVVVVVVVSIISAIESNIMQTSTEC